MSKTLSLKVPSLASEIQKNTPLYLAALDSLNIEVKTNMALIPKAQRVLITAHDAFGYFGLAYDTEVRGLQGISTVSDFGLNDVTQLVNLIVDRKIKSVFVETSVSDQSIRAVLDGCRQKGHNIEIGGTLFSDAMGAANTPEGTYIGMVRKNVTTIVAALK
jgi:manganese/zinc/iron transport system substrate-binding protein